MSPRPATNLARRLPYLLLAIALFAPVAACDGKSSPGHAKALTRAQLAAALPTSADFPAGFTKVTGSAGAPSGCDTLDELGHRQHGSPAAHAEFGNDDSTVTVDLYQRTVTEATQDVATFRTIHSKCQTITDTDRQGTPLKLRLATDLGPTAGDESAAFQASLFSPGVAVAMRAVFVRRSGVEIVLRKTYPADTNHDADILDRLARKLVASIDRQR